MRKMGMAHGLPAMPAMPALPKVPKGASGIGGGVKPARMPSMRQPKMKRI
jgi:hypothetical protein